MDSDGDGIGDLNGITSKLPYLSDLGADAIWLSPIFLSPMYDFGYDISDYRQIAPEYGTMGDFDNMMAEAKKLGEFVSIFRKSAWEYNAVRGQYYLHQFVIGQPDLNYREPKVQQEMKDVLRFWLDKGVSGFRVDAINMMYEVDPKDYDGRYPDEPLSGNANAGLDDYEFLDHIYTKDLSETYDVVYDWRDVLNEYIEKQGEYKIMMTEAYTDLDLMIKYYGDGKRNGSIPFNFSFLQDVTNHSNARDIKTAIDKWMLYKPVDEPANWVNGNHDQSRLASRQGTDRVDAMNMMSLLLPGVSITYQGEEIGQTDGYVSWEDTKDPQACNTDDPINYWKKSRDPNRTPYQWDSGRNAGFSNASATWLPVADNYKTVNLAAQQQASKSHYKFYKDVAAVKKTAAVQEGDLDSRALSTSVLVVTRLLPGAPGVVGVVNLSDQEQTVDLSPLRLVPSQLQVVASGVDCKLEKGTKVDKSSIAVSAHCAIALETTTNCC